MIQQFISVVTPFYNTEQYLAQCIESVLGQTHAEFEYLLVDNCSTDRSGEIANAYAARDSRIRLIRRADHLPQVQNYNQALDAISGESKYCKLVQADDYVFPDCLRLMVQAFEQSESIGLVSSYWLKGDVLWGAGPPVTQSHFSGQEIARAYLRTRLYLFGSPTTVMYRSTIVRSQRPFYDESLLHEDTEKCLQILQDWDFGFVHQVLSYLRTENESISSGVRSLQPNALDTYVLVQRYAGVFLDAREAEAVRAGSRRDYYRTLAAEALRFRSTKFWNYHAHGLKTLGQKLDRSQLALQIAWTVFHMAANPGIMLERLFRRGRHDAAAEKGVAFFPSFPASSQPPVPPRAPIARAASAPRWQGKRT